jgi:hypothetical protein
MVDGGWESEKNVQSSMLKITVMVNGERGRVKREEKNVQRSN